MTIEMTVPAGALPADAAAEAEAAEQRREWIARAFSVLFAAAAVIVASLVAVLIQLS